MVEGRDYIHAVQHTVLDHVRQCCQHVTLNSVKLITSDHHVCSKCAKKFYVDEGYGKAFVWATLSDRDDSGDALVSQGFQTEPKSLCARCASILMYHLKQLVEK